MPINWDFDSKEYNPDGQFSPLPPGDYRVRIEEAEETQSKSGNDMIKVTLSVSGKSNKLWHYIVFPRENDMNYIKRKQMTNQKLGEFWESFDLKIGDLNTLNWRGKVGAARVKQEMNEQRGEMQNAISYFLTRKRQEDLASWSEPGGKSTQPSSAPVSMREEAGNESWKTW